MQATTRWHKGTKQIRFADNVIGKVINATKHGFICSVNGKIAHVWTFDIEDKNHLQRQFS